VGLHIIYRSYAGENRKNRPTYYSKDVALASFVRAVQALDGAPDVIFLNDGEVPVARLEVMRRVGEPVQVHCGSNLASYRRALRLALERGWPVEDVVWLAEDDYLYRPDALQVLVSGVRALPEVAYFSLYSPWAVAPGIPGAGGARSPISSRGAVRVEGVDWLPAPSTTSTFAVRIAALRTDHRLLYLCPLTGGAWDHTSCLAVQGIRPFAWADLRRELAALPKEAPRRWARVVARVAVRCVMNVRATRRRRNRRLLYAAHPLPIWHLETAHPAGPGIDQGWDAVAEQTRAWARQAIGSTTASPPTQPG
jgi:hypothetical protein